MGEEAKGKHQCIHFLPCFSVTILIHICTEKYLFITAALIRQEPGSPISEFSKYYQNTCIQKQNW